MSNDAFQARSTALQGAFCSAVDKQLIDDLKKELDLQSHKEALAAASGVTDESTLDKLADLNIAVEALAAFSLFPLIAVAWADGKIEANEKEAILKAAGQCNTKNSEACFALLEDWLTHQPEAGLLSTWTDYVKSIRQSLDERELAQLKSDIVGGAKKVAEAAGGFLGLGNKISSSEQTVLDELNRAFDQA